MPYYTERCWNMDQTIIPPLMREFPTDGYLIYLIYLFILITPLSQHQHRELHPHIRTRLLPPVNQTPTTHQTKITIPRPSPLPCRRAGGGGRGGRMQPQHR
ncbi:hypothetical protein BT67DRAFT_191932 [Trichocladium antarcticum]|uniref:Uncharacterized protein n=1 Tax=Trichocladium antarcticum TaxID=1450529 RepID=A0AAN6UPZ7_9PEZI|nr:hypothetical protein BT67DRAFT_191932 [Trichocladium antarcticum]